MVDGLYCERCENGDAVKAPEVPIDPSPPDVFISESTPALTIPIIDFKIPAVSLDVDVPIDGVEFCCELLQGAIKKKGGGSGTVTGSIDHEDGLPTINFPPVLFADKLCDGVKAAQNVFGFDVLNCEAALGLTADSIKVDGALSVSENHCRLGEALPLAIWSGSGLLSFTNSRVSGELTVSLTVPFVGKSALTGTLNSNFDAYAPFRAEDQSLFFTPTSDGLKVSGCIDVPMRTLLYCFGPTEQIGGGSTREVPVPILPAQVL